MNIYFFTLRFSYINMRSPSLPMVPQRLEITLGVKTSTRYPAPPLKIKAQMRRFWNLAPYVVIRGQVTSHFSALPAQNLTRQ